MRLSLALCFFVFASISCKQSNINSSSHELSFQESEPLFLVGEKEPCRISEERVGGFRKWLRENVAQLPRKDETKDLVLLSALEKLPSEEFKTITPVCNPDLEQAFLRKLTPKSSGSLELDGGPLEPGLGFLRLLGMATSMGTTANKRAYECVTVVYDALNRFDNYLLSRSCGR